MDTNGFETEAASFALPVGCIPTPTREGREHRRLETALRRPGLPRGQEAIRVELPRLPIPPILIKGPRVLMWKQDPTVTEIGIRKAYLPFPVFQGPRDARILIQGIPTVSPNAFGDYVQTPGTPEFDAVHTFAVVRQALTMCERQLARVVPWQWNSTTNSDPLKVFPRAGDGMNAFYSRTQRALEFLHFIPPGEAPTAPRTFTCRSFDIVAHETGHAVLDGLKPGWLGLGNPPQTGALHESFGDLMAVFLALSQLDQVEAVVAQTKANLHDKTFLSDVAEQFGLALGRPNGLRNADNDFKLSQVGTQVHSLSQVFTGAIYDILADLFALERSPKRQDEARTLLEVADYLFGLVLRAIIAAPASGATFIDVGNKMRQISSSDGKPDSYRTAIRNRFIVREIALASSPLSAAADDAALQPAFADMPHTHLIDDRMGCCGTMTLPDNVEDGPNSLDSSVQEFLKQLSTVEVKTVRRSESSEAPQKARR